MNRKEAAAIVVSFVVTSALGVLFVYGFWSDQNLHAEAVLRSVVFVAIMGGVHFVAARLYISQGPAVALQPDNATSPVESPAASGLFSLVSPLYQRAMTAAVIQQMILLGISSLLLDMGQAFRVCGVGALAHWIAIAIIIARRPRSPTSFDLDVIRYGFVPLAVFVSAVAPAVREILDR